MSLSKYMLSIGRDWMTKTKYKIIDTYFTFLISIILKGLIGLYNVAILVDYQIHHLSNIAIVILDFFLLLPIELSLFQLLRQQ